MRNGCDWRKTGRCQAREAVEAIAFFITLLIENLQADSMLILVHGVPV
jgi:hypothetical protein